MPTIIRYILWCYRASLRLYPSELRGAYGTEMADAFEEILNAEWTARGLRGVASAGWGAICELVTIAIPGRLASEGMILIGLSLAMNLGVLALEDMFFVRRGL
jgi:hypothetical protein